jgi:hypothetical protein
MPLCYEAMADFRGKSGVSGPGSRDPAANPAGSRLYFGCMNALRIFSESINNTENHSD